MSSLLPSDMGRLIYGYLRKECNEDLAQKFLDSCDSMKECRARKQLGFNSEIHDRTLVEMVNEYSTLTDLIFENVSKNERSRANIVHTLDKLLTSKLAVFKSSPSAVAPLSNRKIDVQPKEIPTSVSHTTLTRLPVLTPILTPVNKEPLLATLKPLNTNPVILSESGSPFKSTGIFGIVKPTSCVPIIAKSIQPNQQKSARKSEYNCTNSIFLSPEDRSPSCVTFTFNSPTNISPNVSSRFKEANVSPQNAIATTPICSPQSNIIQKEKLLDRLNSDVDDILQKESPDLNSGKEEDRIPILSNTVKDIPTISIPEKTSPPKAKNDEIANVVSAQKANSVIPNVLQVPKPVKILPKIPPSRLKDLKKISPAKGLISSTNDIKPDKSIPWDFALRQSIADEMENKKDTNSSPIKCKKNRTPTKKAKEHKIVAENKEDGNSVHSKRKRCEKKPTICKKLRKKEQVVKIDKKDDEDSECPVRREISEEFVLFHKQYEE